MLRSPISARGHCKISLLCFDPAAVKESENRQRILRVSRPEVTRHLDYKHPSYADTLAWRSGLAIAWTAARFLAAKTNKR